MWEAGLDEMRHRLPGQTWALGLVWSDVLDKRGYVCVFAGAGLRSIGALEIEGQQELTSP